MGVFQNFQKEVNLIFLEQILGRERFHEIWKRKGACLEDIEREFQVSFHVGPLTRIVVYKLFEAHLVFFGAGDVADYVAEDDSVVEIRRPVRQQAVGVVQRIHPVNEALGIILSHKLSIHGGADFIAVEQS